MESVDNHHARTGSDLEYLGTLVGDTSVLLPELPLHPGVLNIQYSVIGGSQEEKADRFAVIEADLRAIADDQGLKFEHWITQRAAGGNKHHHAVLTMPNGKVTYSAVWIERSAHTANGEPCGDNDGTE